MTPLVCMLASLLAAPSDPVSAEATPVGGFELLIPIDATLLATLESGGDVSGEIPPTARHLSQYRLRLVSDIESASRATPENNTNSVSPGTNSEGGWELLIPVDDTLLARLSAGSEVVGAIPSAAHDAARYRLQLTGPSTRGTSTRGTSFADNTTAAANSDAEFNGTGDHVYSVTPAAGIYGTSSDLLLPGPERTNPQAPAIVATSPSASSLIAPPGTTSTATNTAAGAWAATNPATVEPRRMNEFGPIVSSAKDLVTNTIAAAKSLLDLPPPPSEAATLSPTYMSTPDVAGLLDLPPPPGIQPPGTQPSETDVQPLTPATGAPAYNSAPQSYGAAPLYSTDSYNAPRDNDGTLSPSNLSDNAWNDRGVNLTSTPSAPAPSHEPAPAYDLAPVDRTAFAQQRLASKTPPQPPSNQPEQRTSRSPEVPIEDAATGPTGLAAPGTDITAPGKDEIDLAALKDNVRLESRPWAVLSFSLFGLFASMGGNVFLGWVAWNHRGRYLDLLRKMRREKARA